MGTPLRVLNDEAAGFEVDERFERFNQRFDVFNRCAWDETVRTEKAVEFFRSYFTDLARFRPAEGFQHRDYALRNASWYLADVTADLFEESDDRKEGFLDFYTMLRPGATARREATPEENAADVKRAARFLGADLVGITAHDERWVYSRNYSRKTGQEKPLELPEGLDWVVVVANEMDPGVLATLPSALGGAAAGQGYGKDIVTILALAAFIRNLGYRAVASLNDTALSIPLAVQAGLGEVGRHGLLITKEFGPRVRLAKLFTDLPLVPDAPRPFGVRAFCESCKRCARACPPKAIPIGPPSFDRPSEVSCLKGVRKWTPDPEKCFGFWAAQGTDCAVCIRVCPYNRDFHRPLNCLGRRLAATAPGRRLLPRIDDALGFGKRLKPKAWWRQDAAGV